MAKLVQDLGKLKKRLREEAEEQAEAPASALKAADKGSDVTSRTSGGAAKKVRGSAENDANKNKEGKRLVDTKKVLAKAGAKSKAKGNGKRGRHQDEDPADMHVIYIGHAPKGFEEEAMEKFFSQFGKVRRVKVFRSAKTGNTKGYAYVQFADAEVAQVAAESTDGYLLGERQLVAHVVDKSKCHAGMFLPYAKKEVDQTVTAKPSSESEEISKSKKRRMNRSSKRLRAIASEYGL